MSSPVFCAAMGVADGTPPTCSGVAIIQATGAVAPVKNSELIRGLGLDQPMHVT